MACLQLVIAGPRPLQLMYEPWKSSRWLVASGLGFVAKWEAGMQAVEQYCSSLA